MLDLYLVRLLRTNDDPMSDTMDKARNKNGWGIPVYLECDESTRERAATAPNSHLSICDPVLSEGTNA